MSRDEIEFRLIRESDLDDCLRMTQAERWPHRLSDWQLHFRLGNAWVAVQDNRVMGVAMWWSYEDRIATIGLVLVDASMQGRGIGRRLMDAVMVSADPCTLKLMSTEAGFKLYQQCGFHKVGKIGQSQGEIDPVSSVALPQGVTSRPVRHEDLENLVNIDRDGFGAGRRKLIAAILEEGRGVLVESNGQALGYALIRKSGHGQTIGPVVASEQSLAIVLVAEILSQETGFIRLDVDLEATEFSSWLETIGIHCIDQVTIMTRPSIKPNLERMRVFGLASQALG